MLSKKAAGLIGLGATMTGAVGSQMTSASLIDLMKKDQGNYQQHLEKEKFYKYRSATYNLVKTMCFMLPAEDIIDVLDQLKKILEGDEKSLTDEEKKSVISACAPGGHFSAVINLIASLLNSRKREQFTDAGNFYKGIIEHLLEKVKVRKTKGSEEKDFFFNTGYFKRIFELKGEKDSADANETNARYEKSSKVLDEVYEKILDSKTLTEQEITELEKYIPSTAEGNKGFSEFLGSINLKKDDLLKGSLKDDVKDKVLNFLENIELREIIKFYSSSIKGRKIVLNEMGYQSTGDKAVSYGLAAGKVGANYATHALAAKAGAAVGTAAIPVPILGTAVGVAAGLAISVTASFLVKTGVSLVEENLNKSLDSVHLELNSKRDLLEILKDQGKKGVKNLVIGAVTEGVTGVSSDLVESVADSVGDYIGDVIGELSDNAELGKTIGDKVGDSLEELANEKIKEIEKKVKEIVEKKYDEIVGKDKATRSDKYQEEKENFVENIFKTVKDKIKI